MTAQVVSQMSFRNHHIVKKNDIISCVQYQFRHVDPSLKGSVKPVHVFSQKKPNPSPTA